MTKQLAFVSIAKEVDGIEMGVLADGTPYLTGRGLAKLCGVVPSAIIKQKDQWAAGVRSGKFAKLMLSREFEGDQLCLDATRDGQAINAYPDHICTAFLEYYAFEAVPRSEIALANFRKLAGGALRLFIYAALGYDPTSAVPPAWRQFHDRLLTHQVPAGYFSVFREMSDLVLTSIRAGLVVDHNTIPDISVGTTWASFWTENSLDGKYGARAKTEHNYPEYFPQARSNPQQMWIYPVDALGEFRRWMQGLYLPSKFPTYLKNKVKVGALPPSSAELLLKEVVLKELPAGDEG